MHAFSDPIIALFLAIAVGYLIGKIKIGPVRIGGVCGTLFAALVIGQAGVKISSDLKETAFVLFIFTLGFMAGPQFFANIRGGWRYGVFSLIEVIVALSLTLLFVFIFKFDVGTAAGIFAGSATESAVVGTASEAVSHMDISADQVRKLQANIATAYSLTYLFGMVGIILFASQVAPYLLRVNLREAAESLEAQLGAEAGGTGLPSFVERVFHVGSQAGRRVGEIEERLSWNATISGIERAGETFEAKPDTQLKEGDLVFVRGRRTAVIAASKLLGEEVHLAQTGAFEVVSREVVLTRREALVANVAELSRIAPPELRRGVFIAKIERLGQSITALPKTELQKGDVLTLYGPEELVAQAAEKLGAELPGKDHTDFVILGLGVVAGLVLGSLSMTIGGVELTLGKGGGALISGLVFGWIHMQRPRVGTLPSPAANFAKDLGLATFIAAIGLQAAPDALVQLKQYGLVLPLIGLIVSVGPALVSLIVGYKLMKIPLPIMLGAVAGQHCSTPTLLAVLERTGNTTPVIGYTVTYAISNVILPLMGSVIVPLAAIVVSN